MLYIYTDKMPKDTIFDVDVAFQIYERRDMKHPVAVNLMKAIDGAKYVSDDCIKTPFGVATVQKLSSGCKAALLALWTKEVVNFTEAGDNVYRAVLKYAKDVDIKVFTNNMVSLSSDDIVCVNGKKMTARKFSRLSAISD